MGNNLTSNYIRNTVAHIERINELVQEQIDEKAFAFLECSVYQFTLSGAESDFERDVLCYYQLICESAQYLWTRNPLTEYMTSELNFNIFNYQKKDPTLDNLKGMRIFFSHRFIDGYTRYYDALCNYLNITSTPNKIIVFNGKDNDSKFWNDMREKMFYAVKNFLNKYEDVLKNSSEREKDDFFSKWQNALVEWYSKLDKSYLENLYMHWAEDRHEKIYPPKFTTAPLELLWNRRNNTVSYKCFNDWYNQNYITDEALISNAIRSNPVSFEPPTVFDYVFDKLFCDQVNKDFNEFRTFF